MVYVKLLGYSGEPFLLEFLKKNCILEFPQRYDVLIQHKSTTNKTTHECS